MLTTIFSRRLQKPVLSALLITVSCICLSCRKDSAALLKDTASAATASVMATGNEAVLGSLNTTAGSILREVWNNNIGNDVAQIPWQTTPSATSQLTTFEVPVDAGSNYGERIRGYVIPPVTGNYTFSLAADDAGELWLSKDQNPANKTKIASTLSWTYSREWTKFSSQKSAPVSLTAGKPYYIETLHKQGGGGANLAVQWTLPNGTAESPIPGSRLAPYTGGETVDNSGYTASPVIYLEGKHDITISGKFITGGTEPLITLKNCYNIKIIGNKLSNSTRVGVYLYACRNITVEDNFITNVSSGVYAEQTKEGGIVVNSNQFLNMKGPFPRGQFVQFNNVWGPNSSISYNKGENIMGQSYPEDAISLYQSKGTAASPVKITGNWIRGGGPSDSGGGIMLGDNGGSYLIAQDNILVDPGQFGMAIAGGDHNTIINNVIYGKQQYFTNVGVYINDINGYKTTFCKIGNNKVRYFNKVNYMNNAWISPNSAKPEAWDTNIFGANISAAVLPAVIITKK
jgi:parallel beta-helix repeat protein